MLEPPAGTGAQTSAKPQTGLKLMVAALSDTCPGHDSALQQGPGHLPDKYIMQE